MKRVASRLLRTHAETAEMVPENVDYTAKHEKTIIAEIDELMAEITGMLCITAEDMPELLAMAEIRDKITEIRKSMAENWWKYLGKVADVVLPCPVKVTEFMRHHGRMMAKAVIPCVG